MTHPQSPVQAKLCGTERALWKRAWGSGWPSGWTALSSAPPQQGAQSTSWVASTGALLAGTETWSSHPAWCISGHTWSILSSSSPSNSKNNCGQLESIQTKVIKVIKGSRTHTEERLKDLVFFWRSSGGPYHSIVVLTEWLQWWRLSLHMKKKNKC